jgi:PWWP domain
MFFDSINFRMTDLSNNNPDNIKVSRFGRHQKMKTGFEDFIPIEITRFITVSPSKQKKTFLSTKSQDEKKSMSPTKEVPISVPLLSPAKMEFQHPVRDEVPLPAIKTEKCEPASPIDDQILSDADSALGSSVDEVDTKLSDGDLLWGSVANSVFWPCIVCPDPDSEQTIISKPENIRARDKKPTLLVHVRFFSDNGRRCWLKTQKTFEFSGVEDLETKLSETVSCFSFSK